MTALFLGYGIETVRSSRPAAEDPLHREHQPFSKPEPFESYQAVFRARRHVTAARRQQRRYGAAIELHEQHRRVRRYLLQNIHHGRIDFLFPLNEFPDLLLRSVEDVMVRSIHKPGLSEKYYLITIPGTAHIATYGAHTALSRITPHRASELFPRNKSNTTLKVVFSNRIIFRFLRRRSDDEGDVCALIPSTFIEESGDFSAGCDGLQNGALHAQTLTTLSAAGREHCTTCLGGHAITETVALSALALVRLIRAFHFVEPFTIKMRSLTIIA